MEESNRAEGHRRCGHIVEQARQRRLRQPVDVVLPDHVELAGAHGSLRTGIGIVRLRRIDDRC